MNKGNAIPSTEKIVWGANFNIGDNVRIRVDMSMNVNIPYDSEKNNFTIIKVDQINDFIRDENASGRLYKLDKDGGNWEGKDLELISETKTTTKKPPLKGILGELGFDEERQNKFSQDIRDGAVFLDGFKEILDTTAKGTPNYLQLLDAYEAGLKQLMTLIEKAGEDIPEDKKEEVLEEVAQDEKEAKKESEKEEKEAKEGKSKSKDDEETKTGKSEEERSKEREDAERERERMIEEETRKREETRRRDEERKRTSEEATKERERRESDEETRRREEERMRESETRRGDEQPPQSGGDSGGGDSGGGDGGGGGGGSSTPPPPPKPKGWDGEQPQGSGGGGGGGGGGGTPPPPPPPAPKGLSMEIDDIALDNRTLLVRLKVEDSRVSPTKYLFVNFGLTESNTFVFLVKQDVRMDGSRELPVNISPSERFYTTLKNAVEGFGGYERFMEIYELHYAPKQPTREVTKDDIKDEIASLRTLQKYASTAQEKQEIKARIESLNVLLKYQ